MRRIAVVMQWVVHGAKGAVLQAWKMAHTANAKAQAAREKATGRLMYISIDINTGVAGRR